MAEPQKDGQYPRVNGAMIASRKYDGMIVSVVGKFMAEHPNHEGLIEFQAADQQKILFTTDQGTFPQNVSDPPYWEVVGQVMEDGTVALFITRELSKDMDMGIYNKMLEVQNSPKYAQYFE